MVDTIIRSVPYALVALSLFCLYLIDKSNRNRDGYNSKRLLCVGYLILLFFIGLRGFVMTDFISYYPYFDMIDGMDSIPDVILLKGWEPGFVVYTYICKTIIPNYFAWNFISCAIDLWILYVILNRYSCNHFLSLLVFFIVGGLPLEMNVMRNAKAIFIFLLSIRYIEERKLWHFLIMILIAMTFHLSAILYIPLYFFINKKWPKWILVTIFVVGCVILFSHMSFLSQIANNLPLTMDEESRGSYLISQHLGETSSYGLSLGTIERIITFIILSIIYRKYISHNDSDIIFYNMYFLLFIVFFYFSESHVVVQRFQYLFIPCFWIAYPSLFNKLAKVRIIKYVFIAFLIIKVLMSGNVPENKYDNLLFGIDSYEKRYSIIDFR